jgi:hypothetical protein
LARLIRCAIVASGTKKASAISRVAQAADRAQRERHLGGWREVGVAAAEEQEEGVVAGLGVHRLGQHLFAVATGGLAAPRVDQPPHRDGGEPRPRVVRRALRPDAQRVEEGLLQRVLGGVEVLAAPHQAREHPGDEGPQLALVHPAFLPVGHAAQPMISRTSIHSYIGSPPGPGPPETNAGDLQRALVRLDVDHVPARDQVAGLRVRAVGGDRRGVRAAVAHPGAGGHERLGADVLAALSSTSATWRRNARCASTSSGAHWSIGGTARCGSGPPR